MLDENDLSSVDNATKGIVLSAILALKQSNHSNYSLHTHTHIYTSISLGYNNIASHPCQYNFTRSRLFYDFSLVLEMANLSMSSDSYINLRPGKWQQ
jgi:hypothetical protein